ncbi:MAG TPA: ATP-binding protein [Parvularculaceae bacterium]|nr:ATP-binding protein [Parvularculaceae bacterium]
MSDAIAAFETALEAVGEPAAIIDGTLRVARRNNAAQSHPLLSAERPFAVLSAGEREDMRAAIKEGRSAAFRVASLDDQAVIVLRLAAGDGFGLVVISEAGSTDSFAREQLAAVIATTVDGIICITEDGCIELFNPACERIFDYKARDVIGRNISMLMPPNFAASHDAHIETYAKTGVNRIIGVGREVEGRRRNGEIFPMDLSVGEFFHRGERRFVGVMRDLSARAAAQQRLQELQNQLAHMGRVSAVAEMGSALAHELNQPLTAMTLYLTSAERALDGDSAKAKALFARAKNEAARAGKIIRRIRQMVERSDREMTTFNLAKILGASIDLCKITDAQRNCRFELEGVSQDIAIFGDETQIQQVLVNLIKNALDATENQDNRRVRVWAQRGDMLNLFVEDNGPGVAAAIRPRLFAPFISSKENGLGIGLSICRNIVEAHGGALDLVEDAREGALGGACFRLALPIGAVARVG